MLQRIDVAIDCIDADAQLAFWSEALGYEPYGQVDQYRSLTPPEGVAGPKLVLQQVPEKPSGAKNRLHLDLVVGAAVETEALRLEKLGAARLSERIDEAGTGWIVMADPEGNEFCLCVS